MMPHTFNFVCTAIYVGLTLLVGYAILCSAIQSTTRHWAQILGYSFALGAGCISFILFDFSVAGIKSDKFILVGTAIVAFGLLTFFRGHKRLIAGSIPAPRHKPDALSLLGGIAFILILATSSNICTFSTWPGVNDTDMFGIWLFKAKWVALSPLHPIPTAFFDPTLSYTHQDYPLSLPFFVAGLYSLSGTTDETSAKMLCFPIYLSVVSIIYSALRFFHRRAIALAITAVFCTAPTLCRNAGLLVGETFLIMCFAGTAASLMRWIESREPGDMVLTALFAVLAAFTKNEGLALLPVAAVATLIFAKSRHQLKAWLKTAIIAALIFAPWLIFRIFLPKTHEDYGGKLTQPSTWLQHRDRFGYIAREYFPSLLNAPTLGVIWYLLIIAALVGWRAFARNSTITLWCILIIQLLLYVATFIVTPWPISVLLPMITPKLLTQISPVAALLIGMHLRDMRWVWSDKPAANQLSAPC